MEETDNELIIIRSIPSTSSKLSIRGVKCSGDYLATFGELNNNDSKWQVSLTISALFDDPTVLIEGVLFRAKYLGSCQLPCEGQPTKTTRMCQAEEAVSRIKVRIMFNFFFLSEDSLFSISLLLRKKKRGLVSLYNIEFDGCEEKIRSLLFFLLLHRRID